ncbi:MAG: hypothetical protein QM757_47055 [Paludibaculum sp.]
MMDPPETLTMNPGRAFNFTRASRVPECISAARKPPPDKLSNVSLFRESESKANTGMALGGAVAVISRIDKESQGMKIVIAGVASHRFHLRQPRVQR